MQDDPREPQSPAEQPISIQDEMRTSYLDYAMSVIIGRAIPDVRDGLKPVHRRILYAMRDLNLTPGGSYSKCAKVVGQVLGNYHPHGARLLDAPHADRWAREFRFGRRRSGCSLPLHRVPLGAHLDGALGGHRE